MTAKNSPVLPSQLPPGQSYAGVPRLARFLRLVGDLPVDAAVSPDTQIYSGPLVDAVKRFQRRHGLDADGRLGSSTIKQLNVSLADRVTNSNSCWSVGAGYLRSQDL